LPIKSLFSNSQLLTLLSPGMPLVRLSGKLHALPFFLSPMASSSISIVADCDYEEHLRASFREWLEYRAQTGSNARTERALKRESALVYQEMWHAFASYCAKQGLRLNEIGADQIADFLAERTNGAVAGMLRSKGHTLTPRYAWRMLTLIDRVTRFHAKRFELAVNPAARILLELPQYRFANAAEQDLVPEYFNEDDVLRLIAHLTDAGMEASEKWKAVRDRTAVALMLGGGLSPGDVRAVQVSGIAVQSTLEGALEWTLSLPGNGNAPARDTPLAEWAGRQLTAWLDIRKAKRIPGSSVFPSTLSGKPWSHTGCYEASKSVLQAAGLGKDGGGIFKLRHTFALRQLLNGAGESEVARWLGFLDPASMTRYRRLIGSRGEAV
jgi:integrase